MVLESVSEAKKSILDYFADKEDLKEAIEDESIYDVISEIADMEVDLYYNGLLEWLVDYPKAVEEIEDAVVEHSVPNPFDFYKLIQMGQYEHNYRLLTEAVNELETELKNKTVKVKRHKRKLRR